MASQNPPPRGRARVRSALCQISAQVFFALLEAFRKCAPQWFILTPTNYHPDSGGTVSGTREAPPVFPAADVYVSEGDAGTCPFLSCISEWSCTRPWQLPPLLPRLVTLPAALRSVTVHFLFSMRASRRLWCSLVSEHEQRRQHMADLELSLGLSRVPRVTPACRAGVSPSHCWVQPKLPPRCSLTEKPAYRPEPSPPRSLTPGLQLSERSLAGTFC